MENDLYADCVAAGIPVRNHESDLYIPVNETTRELLQKHDKKAGTYTNQVEGDQWFDVPFAFTPYWDAKAKRS